MAGRSLFQVFPRIRRVQLHVGLSLVFVPLVMLTGAAVALVSYQRTSHLLLGTNRQLIAAIAAEATARMETRLNIQQTERNIASLALFSRADSLAARLRLLPQMKAVVDVTPAINAYYVGYANGDRILLRRLQDDSERQFFQATPDTSYVVQSLERTPAGPVSRRLLFDRQLRLLLNAAAPQWASYDPRTRSWYRQAIAMAWPIVTDVYTFATSGQSGLTVAQRTPDRRAVVGADLRVSTISDILWNLRRSLSQTPSARLALVDGRGRVLALDGVGLGGGGAKSTSPPLLQRAGVPVFAQAGAVVPKLIADLPPSAAVADRQLRIDGRDWIVAVGRAQRFERLQSYLVVAVPSDELLQDARSLGRDSILSTLAVVALITPIVWLLARRITRALRKLGHEAEAVRSFRFDGSVTVRSMVREVDDLAIAIDAMKDTIRHFLAVNAVIAAEPDVDRLMETILAESISAAHARGGALFLSGDGDRRLEPAVVMGPELKPLQTPLTALPTVGVVKLMGHRLDSSEVLHGTLTSEGTPMERKLAYALELEGAPYLALPLASRERNLLGLLLLWFDAPPEPARVAFIEAFSGNAAIALETRDLIASQKALFQAFIELIADAVDAKSPYTGGHCQRVPELTKMLAEAACEAKEGVFTDFSLTPERWEAVHVAAWLHDCGKVITPEYVVDKATKLETIYDRIHEVRTRFEVLKRDAHIRYYQDRLAGGDPSQLAERLEQEWAELDADFAFVAACNEGGEFLSPEHIERLQGIGARTWTRTLDDRLGTSQEERRRMERQPAAPLPVLEPLLADRPDHRLERHHSDRLGPDNPWGFTLQPTEWLYDRGELHNLSISRGTLTPEERYKINEHIVHTIRMLSALPFPRHLRDVPELAGGHHETLVGTGYPKGLRKDQMSEVARMMAIADIFEALTSSDRPYKQAKTLSQALKIMAFMKRDQHIDPDLFALFVSSGVYRRYAERFLQPDQIDAVDEAALLAT
ncbi:HD domain-containing phosphohydrolase [Vulcanococcus limneticus]|uniref:HD domain-containing phosphohydrolase n=1 Tax=Vulcanococcus limneticus TaxID=2170428 RepID=UPI00398BC50B